MSNFSSSERDARQRSLGCIGFSMIAHTGLIVALLIAPKATELGGAPGNAEGGGQATAVELRDGSDNAVGNAAAVAVAKPAQEVPAEPTKADEPKEVVLAPPTDPNAVPVEAEPAKPVEAKPEPKPVEKVAAAEPKVEAKPKAPAKPKKKPRLIAKKPKADAFKEDSKVETDPTAEPLSPVIAEKPKSVDESMDEADPQPAPSETAAPAPIEEPATETKSEPQPETKPDVAPEPEIKAEAQPEARPKAEEPAAPVAEETPAPIAKAGPGSGGGESDAAKGSAKGSGGGDQGGAAGGGQASGSSPFAGKVVDASLREPLAGNPSPIYPQEDRYQHRQGTTVMVGRVGSDGRVSDIQIEKSSGSESLDRESVRAFKKWRFAPGPEAQVRKAFAFQLTGEEKEMPARLREAVR